MVIWTLTWESAAAAHSASASSMNDGPLGPKLTVGHKAPMLQLGITAGVIRLRLHAKSNIKFHSLNDPPQRAGVELTGVEPVTS